jgi:ATP-dependent DNA helicase RecQ
MEYDCGIVYCRTRAQTEELTARLFTKGVPALAYHGGIAHNLRSDFPVLKYSFLSGLKDKERVSAQDDWMKEKSKIIVATVSFGMGVDKSNVR